MTENGNQEIDVAQLMARIREAAEKRKSEPLIDAAATLYSLVKSNDNHEASHAHGLPDTGTLNLEPELESRNRYQLHELTAFHDEAFVRNAYKAILRREPDEAGFARYVASLRSGRFQKEELLAKLKYSPEGQQTQVEVDGLTRLSLLNRIYRAPVVGYLLELVVGLFRLPTLIANQRKFEAHAASQQSLMVEHLGEISNTNKKIAGFHQQQMKAVIKELHELIADQDILRKNVSDHIAAMNERFKQETLAQGVQDDELQRLREMLETKVIRRVQQTRMALVLQERRLLLLMEEARKRLPAPMDESQLQSFETEKDHLLDSLYTSLEDDFRGTREEIKESLSFYLPILKDAGIASDIVDVGCGRGEWLEVMKEAGLRARGVDSNRIMIENSRRAGLEATESDALSYLRSQADNSLSCITAFHFVEHLPLPALVSFLDECARKLKSGGLAVFETPNPENLLVGACNFYLDPTHRNPIPATTLKFLLEARGFFRVEILPLHPPTPAVLKGDDDLTRQLNQKLFGPMDYAIVGRTI